MQHIKNNRKILLPLKKTMGGRYIYTWTGNKYFNKTKGKKFKELAEILEDDAFRSFLSALGWIEVNWALAEQSLDRWVHFIYEKLNGVAIQKKTPVSFSNKSIFLRKAFNDIQTLSHLKLRAIEVLDIADRLATIRNDMTHAAITSMKPDNGVFELKNFKLDKDASYTVKDVSFDVRDFPKLSFDLVTLGNKALHITSDLLDIKTY